NELATAMATTEKTADEGDLPLAAGALT
ncbi:MAG: hypothetical protein ACI8W8_000531, partial [Rhodothermales bacterium]